MKSRSFVAILLALVVLGAAACGDDEPDVDQILNDAEEALDEGLDEAEAEAEDALDAAIGDFGATECIELGTAMAEAAGAATGVSSDPEAAVESIRNMSEVAPDEISDDLVVLADGFEAFLAVLTDAGIDITDPSTYSSEEATAALVEASAVLESSGLEEASENISAAMADLCGG